MIAGAHQHVTGSGMTGVEAKAWALTHRLEKIGYAELSAELGISMAAAIRIIRAWETEGRVRVAKGGGRGGRRMFSVTPEYRIPTDRGSLVADQFWAAIRVQKRVSPVDILANCREDLRVDIKEARAYCQALTQGGYLRVIHAANPAVGREAVYQLVNDTGPRAPRERRVNAVWDPNEGCYAFVSGLGRLERAR